VLPSKKETPTSAVADPWIEYTHRLNARRGQEARQAKRYTALARARNIFFVLIVLVAWLGEKERMLPLLLVLPAAFFVTFMVQRNLASRAWRRARLATEFYERRLACVEERWAGGGEPGLRFLNDNHPYARDLDLFGAGCLFELLCTARTPAGENTLAAWLLSPASLEDTWARQAAVAELCAQLDVREEFNLLAADIPGGNHLEALAEWGQAEQPALVALGLRLTAMMLMTLSVATLVAWILGAGPAPFLLVLVLEGLFTLSLSGQIRRVLEPLEQRAANLLPFARLLNCLESQAWSSPLLVGLRATLEAPTAVSSQRIRQLARLVACEPLAFLLLWITPLGLAVEGWRRTSGRGLARWLAAIGEFEALSALAGYSYENPADPFPDLISEGPCYEAEGLGHPLLPKNRCVRNDVRLNGDLHLLIVSGSNMAGKSTLLRTIGVNAVLGLCGAPVRARRLRLSRLTVGATLRIQDSLQDGRSRFYMEITRLRQVLELAKGTLPLLFLLDELLQGTNSDERRLGAEAVIRTLLDHRAIGLVTTHDLSLTQIADLLKPRAANVHFEDRFENGTMIFDYQMRPGVAQSRNALALMRAVGFEV
jgi:hypothetical protein